jgi:hypothetical protein
MRHGRVLPATKRAGGFSEREILEKLASPCTLIEPLPQASTGWAASSLDFYLLKGD